MNVSDKKFQNTLEDFKECLRTLTVGGNVVDLIPKERDAYFTMRGLCTVFLDYVERFEGKKEVVVKPRRAIKEIKNLGGLEKRVLAYKESFGALRSDIWVTLDGTWWEVLDGEESPVRWHEGIFTFPLEKIATAREMVDESFLEYINSYMD